MPKATDPKVVAFLVCDQVIQDIRTGKKSYIGVFDNIFAPKVPCVHPQLNVVVILTGCRGKQNITLEMVFDAPEGENKIMELEGALQSEDPLAMHDLIFELRSFPFVQFGKYTLRVVSGDSKEIISYRHFRVAKQGG
jgi:hypothetical protein